MSGRKLPSKQGYTGSSRTLLGLITYQTKLRHNSKQYNLNLREKENKCLENVPLPFMEPESSLPYSHDPPTRHYPAPDEFSTDKSNPYHPILSV
jgi:hypothetical protein